MNFQKLTCEESQSLYGFLRAEQRPLHEIIEEFKSTFSPPRHFTLCSYLTILLQDKKVLNTTERLIAFALIVEAYSSQKPASNPFINFIIHASCHEEPKGVERAFILKLLHVDDGPNSNNEFLKQSASDYVTRFDQSSNEFPPLDHLQQLFSDKNHQEPYDWFFKGSFVQNVVPDPDFPPNSDTDSSEFVLRLGTKPKLGTGDKDEAEVELLSNLSLDGPSPHWIRPLPPRLRILDGKLVWLSPDIDVKPDEKHKLLWDLIAKAREETLVPAQQQHVLVELANDPKLVYYCGLTPRVFPELVQNNPLIATEILFKLINSPQIAEYLKALVNMDMTHSMQVVNRLTAAVELPSQFIHMYITNCVSSCMNIEDKSMQNRDVRCVCVFLQSLSKSNYINVTDLLSVVQTFCIHFIRIREAVALFRHLKSLERAAEEKMEKEK